MHLRRLETIGSLEVIFATLFMIVGSGSKKMQSSSFGMKLEQKIGLLTH